MKIDLPGDMWATLRRPEEVPERLRRPIGAITGRALNAPGLTAAVQAKDEAGAATALGAVGIQLMYDLNDALIVALVKDWSYETPVSVETLGDLPGEVYDALQDATAPFLDRLLPNFGVSPDPASPTVPSSV